MLSILAIAASLMVALLLYELLVILLGRRLHARGGTFWEPLMHRSRRAVRLALIVFALNWAVAAAPLPQRPSNVVQHVLWIAFIVLCGVVANTAIDVASALYTRRFKIDAANNPLSRKYVTQVRILRGAGTILVVVVTAAFALMTIPQVRELGVSLLAAGGAAGIIVGLALQPVLANIMAGVQIALTQPLRIDDAVNVEGETGVVEEITVAYVVIRIWDKRRMIVPLRYFLERPFQNWTRTTGDLIGTVMLYLDYATPLEPLRAKLKEVLEASPLWDGEVMSLQVTDARERTMEVRILVGALDAGRTFALRCEVREKLIGFLQAEHPQALPRDRVEVRAPEPRDADAPGRLSLPSSWAPPPEDRAPRA